MPLVGTHKEQRNLSPNSVPWCRKYSGIDSAFNATIGAYTSGESIRQFPYRKKKEVRSFKCILKNEPKIPYPLD